MTTNILSFLSGAIAEKFEANFRAQRKTESFAKFIVEHGSKEEAVSAAFSWAETPEGYYFWEAVNNLWLKFLKEGGEPMTENPNMEILILKCRVKDRIEEDKLSVDSVLKIFGELFGDKVFRAFKTNVEHGHTYKAVENLTQDVISNSVVFQLVLRAFDWLYTPEGREYWSQISDMWEEYWEAKTGMRSVNNL